MLPLCTQEDLADRVGLSPSYVGQIERPHASTLGLRFEMDAAELVRR
jgi:transcriptional regulator with XRE-family HTH domain